MKRLLKIKEIRWQKNINIKQNKEENIMFEKIGMQELLVIAFIALLIFGPKNLPEI